MPTGVMSAMVARIKLLGRMDMVEKRRPQDGRIKTRNPKGDEVEMRLSTLPTAFGEKMVMRIFDPATTVKSTSTGSASARTTRQRWEALVDALERHRAGHRADRLGQDHHALHHAARLATDEVNVCTIEDPIEMIQPAFNQTQVQPGSTSASPRACAR